MNNNNNFIFNNLLNILHEIMFELLFFKGDGHIDAQYVLLKVV
jgi:hypothetical protein